MSKQQMGPLQLIVFSFKTPNFKGEILDELNKLNQSDLLRLVDGLAIQRNLDGSIQSFETSQLDVDEMTDYGRAIGKMIGLGADDVETSQRTGRHMAANFHARYEYGLNEDDIKTIADNIPAGSAAIFALVEHRWAIPLRDSVKQAGGTLLAEDFLSPEMLMSIGSGSQKADPVLLSRQ